MRAEALTGPQVTYEGSQNPLRQGRMGALVVTELHGKYQEQTQRGNVFMATSALGALQTGPGISGAPLCLYNPIGSGKNLCLLRVSMALATLPGTQVAGAFAYYFASKPVLTTLTLGVVNSALVGSGLTGQGVVYTAATLGSTPTLLFPIAGKSGTAPAANYPTRIVDDLDGQIVLAQGGLLLIQETVADTTSLWGAALGFCWEEVPV